MLCFILLILSHISSAWMLRGSHHHEKLLCSSNCPAYLISGNKHMPQQHCSITKMAKSPATNLTHAKIASLAIIILSEKFIAQNIYNNLGIGYLWRKFFFNCCFTLLKIFFFNFISFQVKKEISDLFYYNG